MRARPLAGRRGSSGRPSAQSATERVSRPSSSEQLSSWITLSVEHVSCSRVVAGRSTARTNVCLLLAEADLLDNLLARLVEKVGGEELMYETVLVWLGLRVRQRKALDGGWLEQGRVERERG